MAEAPSPCPLCRVLQLPLTHSAPLTPSHTWCRCPLPMAGGGPCTPTGLSALAGNVPSTPHTVAHSRCSVTVPQTKALCPRLVTTWSQPAWKAGSSAHVGTHRGPSWTRIPLLLSLPPAPRKRSEEAYLERHSGLGPVGAVLHVSSHPTKPSEQRGPQEEATLTSCPKCPPPPPTPTAPGTLSPSLCPCHTGNAPNHVCPHQTESLMTETQLRTQTYLSTHL